MPLAGEVSFDQLLQLLLAMQKFREWEGALRLLLPESAGCGSIIELPSRQPSGAVGSGNP